MDRLSPSSLGRAVALSAGLYALLGGVVTLVGWAVPLPRLTDWLGKGISMFPNAAVAGMGGGAALLLLGAGAAGAWRRRAARLLAAVTALIGGLTLLQHVTGANFGLDELLFRGTWGQAVSMAPMRIGVPASTAFLLLGLCLLLATGGAAARRVASGLAVLPVAIALLALTGYWFGANELFGVARFTGIAWQTATIIAALGIGMIAALPRHGLMALLSRDDAGGVVARRFLLPLVGIPLLLGWLRVVGQQAGLYDPAFGTALRTLAEVGLLLALLWWTAGSISRHAAATRSAAEALRTSEDRFARFMQSLPGLAWIKDRDGRYVFVNDAAAAAFQCRREDLQGRTDAEFLPAETAALFRENDRRALATAKGVQVIETLRHANGVEHSSVVSKFPIPGPDGAPALVGGIAIDITDRMRAEEALREAHRRKDEFLATLAHELRNPLAPIRYALQFLTVAAPAADGDSRWALEVIDRQVQQMARLLEDLLDVSRISYGKLTLRPERLDLTTIVERAVETSRPHIEAGGHALTIELPPEPVALEADPVRLAQVFSNLLNNAAKYTPRGGRIHITARREHGDALVTVADTGIGLAAEVLPSIFDMFSQADRPPGGAQGGLGIGLSLVRGLVRLHGGSVEAQSDGPGRGSTFVVRIPAAAAVAAPVALVAPAAEKSAAPDRSPPRRILVADDLRDGADSIAAVLRALGHEVHVAYQGEAAVALAETCAPEIALLDIGMPRLDGHEVCRRLRQMPGGGDVFIVAITGWGQATDRARTTDAGFDHHLVKPVDVPSLLRLLDSVARRR